MIRFRTIFFLIAGLVIGCGDKAADRATEPLLGVAMQLTSTAFRDGEPIPAKYTCDGKDISPPLNWTGAPPATRSFALICDDPDAPIGTWVHWIVYDLPRSVTELREKVPGVKILTAGGNQAENDFKNIGYGGPCPPKGKPHRYFFRIYALDATLDLRSQPTKAVLLEAMQGHILGEGRLMGTYARP